MRVLVCGANGFIGRALCEALARAGHRVVRGVRSLSGEADEITIDFTRDTSMEAWLPRLESMDAVINAVGALAGPQLARVHREAPIALFAACARQGVRRVIQISALGAAADAPTEFLRTKFEGDAALAGSSLDWIVLRPSLVAGREGSSSRWFRSLASLPLIPLPGRGTQIVQPVALSDLVDATLRALSCEPARRVVDAVGPEPLTLRGMLAGYRALLDLGTPRWLPVPLALVRLSVRIGRPLGIALASADTLRMLEAGSRASPAALANLLGRSPHAFISAFGGVPAADLRAQAALAWAEPLLRVSLAIVWLVTAWVSLFAFPVWDSLRMLVRTGVPAWSAPLMLVGAAVLDAVFGVLTLLRPSRVLWWAQLALIVFYSAVIAARLPEMWAHPFGPLLKNVPIVAILLVLLALTPTRSKR